MDYSSLNVLVVDDEPSMRGMIKSILGDLSITQVFTARDGREALSLLGEFDDIDIVISDWVMPRISGLELLRQIRTVDRELPFMMLTGKADVKSVEAARACGVSDYLAKPFSRERLGQKLERLARLRAEEASEWL